MAKNHSSLSLKPFICEGRQFSVTRHLKEQSLPCVSKLTSANVTLAMKLGRGQFCDVIGQRHEFHLKDVTDYTPEMVQ